MKKMDFPGSPTCVFRIFEFLEISRLKI